MEPTGAQKVEALDAIQLAAVSRSDKCSLMAYVLKKFPSGSAKRVPAQLRTFCFYLWCSRRAIISYTSRQSYRNEMVEGSDYRIDEFCRKLAEGDESRGKAIMGMYEGAFGTFDAAMQKDAGGSEWVSALAHTVIEFITQEPFTQQVIANMSVLQLPAQVLIEIHRDAAKVLKDKLGVDVHAR